MIDLGRDVPPEVIVQNVEEDEIRLVGLSALMTTTLPAMEETIRQLHTLENPPMIMVGGAVVTPEYALHMQADYYAKDAREAAEIAGIGPSTVVNCHADKGVLMLVKEQEETEQGVCICPECLADMLAESEDESYKAKRAREKMEKAKAKEQKTLQKVAR